MTQIGALRAVEATPDTAVTTLAAAASTAMAVVLGDLIKHLTLSTPRGTIC
jgi:hypothetical protein